MKKILLFLFLFIFSFTPVVFAHMPGQPPYFKIDGKYSGFYPVYSSSVKGFSLPQDIAPDNYLVGENLNFEIDTNQLKIVVPINIINQTKFEWDFGDGKKATGLSNSHSYSRISSYILTIYANTSAIDNNPPQLIQSVLLNIVSDKNFKLPRSVVKVNGQKSVDPLTDFLYLKFGDKFKFDGSDSSGSIISYFWDLGDGNSSSQKIIEHVYKPDSQIVFPLLRVNEKDGFISDSYVEINNSIYGNKNLFGNQKKTNQTQRSSQLPYVLAAVLIAAGAVILKRKLW